VARGASYIIIQNITASAAMAVSFAVIARLITTEEMGIMAVLLLVQGFCQLIATLALQQAVTKFISENLEPGGKHVAASVFYQAMRLTLLSATLIALVVFLGASLLASEMLGDQTHAVLFQVLGLDIVLYAGALPVLTGTMLGLQRFKETAMIGIINTLVRQSLIIVLIVFLQDFLGLVIAWVIADSVAASIYMGYISRALGRPRFGFPLTKLLGFSWPLTVSNAATFASAWFDRALLLIFVPLATLGVYNATVTAFSVLVGIPGAMTAALFPAYSAMQSHPQRQALSQAVLRASRYVSLVGVPVALGLLATAKPALTLFVGQAYVEGTEPLMLLSGTFALALVGTVLTPMLLALGETGIASTITTASVGISVVTAYILLPFLGMNGAAVARGVGMIAATAITVLILRRRLSLQLDTEAISKSLVAGIVMAAAVFFAQLLLYNKFLLPLYAILGGIVYVGMLRLLRVVRGEDLELISGYFGKRFAPAANILRRILT
jgi:O-antigen/teichoic acid export membrane protein